jgi:hypothetical protein
LLLSSRTLRNKRKPPHTHPPRGPAPAPPFGGRGAPAISSARTLSRTHVGSNAPSFLHFLFGSRSGDRLARLRGASHFYWYHFLLGALLALCLDRISYGILVVLVSAPPWRHAKVRDGHGASKYLLSHFLLLVHVNFYEHNSSLLATRRVQYWWHLLHAAAIFTRRPRAIIHNHQAL